MIETLHQVHDNEVEELDLLVGLMAEMKIKDLPLVRLLLLYSLSWHPGVCVCVYILHKIALQPTARGQIFCVHNSVQPL
jgi:hypothetical protein